MRHGVKMAASMTCTVLHNAALCVNTRTDNSGFHDIKFRDVLRSVLLTRSVWTGRNQNPKLAPEMDFLPSLSPDLFQVRYS